MSFPNAPMYRDGPQPPRDDQQGSGEGSASLVFSVLAIPSMVLTAVPTVFAVLFTRPDTGTSGLDWVAPAVLFSLPVLFGLLGTVLGILAVRRNHSGTKAWRSGVAGLWIVGTEAAFFIIPAVVQGIITLMS
ncbi:hypothetical protein SRABI83_03366 [Arthrobacter sp. Bi83]|uniref:hypothetical protein n=1 Tax=Arthrobacter sp. Bi83 TaxID=2822353 RepID=UPI001D35DE1B|nr:hypothetical protein [Arthrobacter sp. Bi83]CAH0260472.1 hypothetical protein SRABI83_03366 [Arthrobacter sp. Bi83]